MIGPFNKYDGFETKYLHIPEDAVIEKDSNEKTYMKVDNLSLILQGAREGGGWRKLGGLQDLLHPRNLISIQTGQIKKNGEVKEREYLCWTRDPSKRISFKNISDLVENSFKENSYAERLSLRMLYHYGKIAQEYEAEHRSCFANFFNLFRSKAESEQIQANIDRANAIITNGIDIIKEESKRVPQFCSILLNRIDFLENNLTATQKAEVEKNQQKRYEAEKKGHYESYMRNVPKEKVEKMMFERYEKHPISPQETIKNEINEFKLLLKKIEKLTPEESYDMEDEFSTFSTPFFSYLDKYLKPIELNNEFRKEIEYIENLMNEIKGEFRAHKAIETAFKPPMPSMNHTNHAFHIYNFVKNVFHPFK